MRKVKENGKKEWVKRDNMVERVRVKEEEEEGTDGVAQVSVFPTLSPGIN